MSNLRFTTVNWESQRVLSQIADHINKPLSEIVRLIKYIQTKKEKSDHETDRISSIMLESSEQIERLIEDIMHIERNKRVEIKVHNKFQYPELYKKPHNRIPQAELEWLIQMEGIIMSHIAFYGLNVSWLANELNVSERNIFRKIEKFTGLTPNNYIRNLRLHRAKELLESYALSTVNEVACAVGLKDPHYFSNLYKKQFGVKPKDYLV